MSVADDLQKLLDASRKQNNDVKRDQRQFQNEKTQLSFELMQSKHEARELFSRNETLINEIDTMQHSMLLASAVQSSINSDA